MTHANFQCRIFNVKLARQAKCREIVMTAEPGSPLVAGKVAFVTGGARGLGRAIVNALASAGAVGAVFDVLTDEQISDLPDGWTFRRGDVTDENVVRSAIAATVQDLGRLDIVVANAGIVPPWRTTQDLNLEEWRRTFAVNVEGIAITLKNTVPHMMSAGGLCGEQARGSRSGARDSARPRPV